MTKSQEEVNGEQKTTPAYIPERKVWRAGSSVYKRLLTPEYHRDSHRREFAQRSGDISEFLSPPLQAYRKHESDCGSNADRNRPIDRNQPSNPLGWFRHRSKAAPSRRLFFSRYRQPDGLPIS